MKAAITSVGHYLPNTIIDNALLEDRFGIDKQRIYERTGILERRYSEPGSSSTMLACEAIKEVLKSTDLGIDEIDCIIVSTLAPDFFFPSTAVAVIHSLKASNAWGFDVSASCSGFLYSVFLARNLIEQGNAKNIIVCATERLSTMLNNFDYKTGVLFGDGAGAVLVQGLEDHAIEVIQGTICQVKADNMNDVYFKTPFNTKDWQNEKFELEGYKVFQEGVQLAIDILCNYMDDRELNVDDIDFVIPHQANARMLEAIAIGARIPIEKFLINIEKYGNTGSASIPICISDFYLNHQKIKKGDRLILLSLGAGYTVSLIDLIWKI